MIIEIDVEDPEVDEGDDRHEVAVLRIDQVGVVAADDPPHHEEAETTVVETTIIIGTTLVHPHHVLPTMIPRITSKQTSTLPLKASTAKKEAAK